MKKSIRSHLWVPLVLLAVACVCYGVFRNESAMVFGRASMICLECIGIG